MKSVEKKYIYVFGSNRKFLKLKSYFDENNFELILVQGTKNDSPNTSKSKEELLEDFLLSYKEEYNIIAFISFGKGSVINNVEVIAEIFEIIKNKFDCKNAQFIGPSKEGARIFCNKYLTSKALEDLNIPVPKTLEIFNLLDTNNLENILHKLTFPVVIKAENLSGGRGIKYITDKKSFHSSIKKIISLDIKSCVLTEYLKGVEVTFTVFRLKNNFMRLPASYKKETTKEMIHPDAKVKISGIFKEFEEYFEYVELVMKKYNIFGFFSLQGILIKKDNEYIVKFLEAAPRLTGSTPIMESSLIGFNIFETIYKWLSKEEIYFGYEKRLAIQYSTYIHNGFKTIKKLKKNNFIIEAKYENLGSMIYSEDKRDRIRISFYLEDINTLTEKINIIGNICGNNNYSQEIIDVLSWFRYNHPNIYNDIPKKLLDGNWGSEAKWEFYLASHIPNIQLCSAVFGIPKVENGFILTRTKRGWELPGGHIEENETIKETLNREILEETGFIVERAILFGYRKIIAHKPLISKDGKQYPYPISYIPHFITSSDINLVDYSGKEVLERRIFLKKDLISHKSHVEEIINISIENLDRIN